LVLAEPHRATLPPQAWICAHCHLAGKGDIQKCSEQITFHLQGATALGISSLVFSHLESDLPLVLWWQPPFPSSVDSNIWSWVDRIIFDSATWNNPANGVNFIQEIANCRENGLIAPKRAMLCDLNWTRLMGARMALAAIFDHSAAMAELTKLAHLHLTHGAKSRITSFLFLGWIAAQLRWQIASPSSRNTFIDTTGRQITFQVEEIPEESCFISCTLASPSATFRIEKEKGADHFQLSMEGIHCSKFFQTVCAESSDVTDILLIELGRNGIHPNYFEALEIISPFLLAE